jgi:hypothetical protein
VAVRFASDKTPPGCFGMLELVFGAHKMHVRRVACAVHARKASPAVLRSGVDA